MRGLALTIEPLTDAVRVGLRGELDLEHAYSFDEELRRVEAGEPACVVLDLSELSFLDSCGLSRLVAARKRARRSQRRLVLICGTPAVQRLMSLTDVNEEFEIVSELPAGLRAAPVTAG